MGTATELSEVEAAIRKAVVAGEPVTLETFGGEAGLATNSATLACSMVFGDVAKTLVRAWSDLSDKDAVMTFLAEGFRANGMPDTMSHAMDAITHLPSSDLRPVVRALDVRARDSHSSNLARTEAVAGLLRLALNDPSLRAIALASILAVDDIIDGFAGPRVCRLASLAFEQFHEVALINLLERLSTIPDTASQAAYERGVLEIGLAVASADVASIPDRLKSATTWFALSVNMAEDRRDAKIYLLLLGLLIPISEGQAVEDRLLAARLRDEMTMHLMWDRPTPGAEWLHPPPSAGLEWLPLLDKLVAVSETLRDPDWRDRSVVLEALLDAYGSARAVRPNLSNVVRPAIEAGFVREQSLLAQLDRWIASGDSRLGTADASTLKRNIERSVGREPGKSREAAHPGTRSLPKNSLPD